MKKFLALFLVFMFIIIISLCILYKNALKNLIAKENERQNTTNSIDNFSSNNQSSDNTSSNFPTITIDPGHGGYDPGKVGINDILEKDINLQIALYLKKYLEDYGYTIFITRSEDISLYTTDGGSKKVSDLNNRIKTAKESKSDLLVSIHQNSYSSSQVQGAQVFYYSTSEKGKELAGIIQENIKLSVDYENVREIKGNSEYMLLQQSPCTAVIVECGFLSSPEEAAKLNTSNYQKSMAKAIGDGIITYFSS